MSHLKGCPQKQLYYTYLLRNRTLFKMRYLGIGVDI